MGRVGAADVMSASRYGVRAPSAIGALARNCTGPGCVTGANPPLEFRVPLPVRRLRLLVLVAVVALGLGACDVARVVTGPRTWVISSEGTSGPTQTVTVTDTSGRILAVDVDPPGAQPFGQPANPAGQPNVVLVPWTGGACDTTTAIGVASAGDGLTITVRIAALPAACDAIGIGHVLQLTGSAPIPAASVTISQLPTP